MYLEQGPVLKMKKKERAMRMIRERINNCESDEKLRLTKRAFTRHRRLGAQGILRMFEQVVSLLEAKGLLLKKGTIVDSTLIAAPSSTKNKDHKRDPDAHQVRKGNEWHFGYKAHIGADQDTGLVHHVEVTAANVSDVSVTPKLLSGNEGNVYGDSGYCGAQKRDDAVLRNKRGRKIVIASIAGLPSYFFQTWKHCFFICSCFGGFTGLWFGKRRCRVQRLTASINTPSAAYASWLRSYAKAVM